MIKLTGFYPLVRLLVQLLRKSQTYGLLWLLQSDEMPTAKTEGTTIVLTIKVKEVLLYNLLPHVHHASHKELSCLHKTTCLKRS